MCPGEDEYHANVDGREYAPCGACTFCAAEWGCAYERFDAGPRGDFDQSGAGGIGKRQYNVFVPVAEQR